MNTLDDLRDTLADRARGLPDDRLPGRAAAVRQRARVVRRRQVAGVAAAVVLVLVTVGLGSVVSKPDPVEPARLLPEAPETVEVYGFPYRAVSEQQATVAESGRASIALDAYEGQRVVVFVASGLGEYGDVTVEIGGEDMLGPLTRLVADGASPALPVPSEEVALHFTAFNAPPGVELGLVEYHPTGELPRAGLSNGHALLRDQRGSLTRIGGAFAPADRAEHTFTVTPTADRVWIALTCGASEGYVQAEVGGEQVGGHRCVDARGPDAALVRPVEVTPGRSISVRMWTTREPVGEDRAVLGGTGFGAAAYEVTDGQQVHGVTVERRLESAGRTWQLEEVLSTEGNPVLGTVILGDETGALVSFVQTGAARFLFEIAGRRASEDVISRPYETAQVEREGFAGYQPLVAGEDYTVTLRSLTDEPIVGAILVYRPVD